MQQPIAAMITGLLALLVLPGAAPWAQTHDQMVNAVAAFTATLSPEESQRAAHEFEDPSRTQWTNLPVGMAPRPGLAIADMRAESRIQLHRLLTTMLSSQGYLKVTSILHLDDILNVVYALAYSRREITQTTYQTIKDLDWSSENYYVSLWGSPDTSKPWGLKLEGHHVSINLTSDGRLMTMTPLFLGSDPSEVASTKDAGLRVLSKEEDFGFALINALDDQQRQTATLARDVPEDIITRPDGPSRLERMEGIAGSALSAAQQALLRRLLAEYVDNLEYAMRQAYWNRIDDRGIDAIHFAWIGSYERGKPHYYIIHSPDFIIEYDNISWDRRGADHIHTIWREKGNDFGDDLLKAHYEAENHSAHNQ